MRDRDAAFGREGGLNVWVVVVAFDDGGEAWGVGREAFICYTYGRDDLEVVVLIFKSSLFHHGM